MTWWVAGLCLPHTEDRHDFARRRFAFTAWWWTVDQLMLAALLALMLAGIVLSLAASPPVAARLGLDPFYFVHRHVLYLLPALAVMLATSLALAAPDPARRARSSSRSVSRWCSLTLFIGAEVKGARRWLDLFGVNMQPSEFLKPAFVILIAWLFAESASKPDMPANTFAFVLLLAPPIVGSGAAARFRPDHAASRWSGARCSSWPACGSSG